MWVQIFPGHYGGWKKGVVFGPSPPPPLPGAKMIKGCWGQRLPLGAPHDVSLQRRRSGDGCHPSYHVTPPQGLTPRVLGRQLPPHPPPPPARVGVQTRGVGPRRGHTTVYMGTHSMTASNPSRRPVATTYHTTCKPAPSAWAICLLSSAIWEETGVPETRCARRAGHMISPQHSPRGFLSSACSADPHAVRVRAFKPER